MCGIVAVLARPSRRAAPDLRAVLAEVDALVSGPADAGEAVAVLRRANSLLRGVPGLRALVAEPGAVEALEGSLDRFEKEIARLEADLDVRASGLDPGRHEELSAELVALKDAWWAVRRDRLGMARRVAAMLGPRHAPPANIDGWWALEVALSSLDRLEVRGRDSAGVHVLVTGHGLDPAARDVAEALYGRSGGLAFPSGSARFTGEGDTLGFVYKAAAEIGELGDNVRSLRRAISSDRLLARAVEAPEARATVVAHTRWASVGIISEPNAHPVSSDQVGRAASPYVVAVLNGDVDNHLELRQAEQLSVPGEITTDAKVIPAMMSDRLASGMTADTAFRDTVGRLEGSVAVVASAATTPDELHLALSGSGQALYVGLADDAFVVASEPYGLVEETDRFVRMDGDCGGGDIVVLRREAAGTLDGIRRSRYRGPAPAVCDEDVAVAEITTRDVDRRGFEHFLLKEINEAPSSFHKTLRGRITRRPDGLLAARLGEDALPARLVAAVAGGEVTRLVVVGQGTAAVAAEAVAAAARELLPRLHVEAMPATELSGFGLTDAMRDTLVVAISQSGTTTDTNRTVDLVRARGAHVVAIVNRRNSDLAAKSHGVLYTSDGRDVEMSVASTKAFYAQVAAGWLLAAALAEEAGVEGAGVRDEVLMALQELPVAMEEVLARRGDIAALAATAAPPRRYWAVVGSGPDHVAAREVRIKLSELCYRSISADTTEDKKHIDLSCEPLVVVCAAGLSGPNADDAAKEVSIYRAHKALPVVIAAAGEEARFAGSGGHVVTVPAADPRLAFVLAAMAGHLFGYEAAVAIDAQARALRAVRAAAEASLLRGAEGALPREAEASILSGAEGALPREAEASLLRGAEGALPREAEASILSGAEGALPREAEASILSGAEGALPREAEAEGASAHARELAGLELAGREIAVAAAPFLEEVRAGRLDGNLDASTAVRLVTLLRYATGALPLEAYETETGRIGTPEALLGDLLEALNEGIDQLTRPVDAIRHQAKTVTVGISRSEEALFGVPLVRATLDAGAAPGALGYRALRTLAALDPAVEEVLGFTRYRVDWSATPTAAVVDKGGVAVGIRSRIEDDPRLRGSKHRAAEEREVTVVRGASDGRTVVLVPEVQGQQVAGMTLLHVKLRDRLPAAEAKAVLSGYRTRYDALADAVTETEPFFDDSRLGVEPLDDLLTEPVYELARRWRLR
jgi:glucosamine--fructose-6-phosphate aminotransferase (isomerizing)